MQSGVRGKGAHEGKETKEIFKETAKEGGETVEALKAQETKEHPAQPAREKWKSRYQSVLLSVLVLVLCTGAADQADFEKRWRAFGGWNQEWFEKWGWLGEGMICIQPINRTGREKGEASERVEEGVSLFLREGRLVFFRIRQKPSKEETFQ